MRIRFYLPGVLLLIGLSAHAQLTTPQAVNSGGASQASGGLLLESSLGGLAVQGVANTLFLYTPDFQQPFGGLTSVPPPLSGPGGVKLESGAGIDNAGTSFLNNSGSNNLLLEFTLGEVASRSLSSASQLLTQGILQPFPLLNQSPLPVLGLELKARRVSPQKVALSWTTLQEINNRGFYLERRREDQSAFSTLRFVASNTGDGNSSFPQTYQALDTNGFGGRSFYRLKQVDHDGRYAYSLIRMVDGQVEGKIELKAWPIPATRYFYASLAGTSWGVLQLFDAGGRLLRQVNASENEVVTFSQLAPGTYVLRMQGHTELQQKVVVQ
jgi:hypothetical protein